VNVADLVRRAVDGSPRAVGRLISLVENESPLLRSVAASLAPYTGRARIIGLTGAPGVGKSTCTSALVSEFRGRSLRVGVLAVDPSSPFSGGALLGDRVRMQSHATDSDVFIRSMSARGHLGGLSWATPQALRVLDAAGCDVILVETVGVGQAEVDIASAADTTLVLMAPGMGDGIQAVKAGIAEIADVFVVNKADHDGAAAAVKDLRSMLSLGGRHSVAGAWRPPVVSAVASAGSGIAELVEAVDRHYDWLVHSGELTIRRRARALQEIEAIAVTTLRRQVGDVPGSAGLPALADQVAAGSIDPYSAADELLAAVSS
jgi:LAO/AO transport system kinase